MKAVLIGLKWLCEREKNNKHITEDWINSLTGTNHDLSDAF
jgi:hypothetical protein